MIRRAPRGFTLIELLMVMIVIGILSGIAVLKYIDFKNAANTARVSSDFRAVQVAVFTYWADKESWPNDVGPGQAPLGLGPYMPAGFLWTKPTYTLDYDQFPVGSTFLVGITVLTDDARFRAKLIQIMGSRTPFFVNGDRITYIIIGPEGIS